MPDLLLPVLFHAASRSGASGSVAFLNGLLLDSRGLLVSETPSTLRTGIVITSAGIKETFAFDAMLGVEVRPRWLVTGVLRWELVTPSPEGGATGRWNLELQRLPRGETTAVAITGLAVGNGVTRSLAAGATFLETNLVFDLGGLAGPPIFKVGDRLRLLATFEVVVAGGVGAVPIDVRLHHDPVTPANSLRLCAQALGL